MMDDHDVTHSSAAATGDVSCDFSARRRAALNAWGLQMLLLTSVGSAGGVVRVVGVGCAPNSVMQPRSFAPMLQDESKRNTGPCRSSARVLLMNTHRVSTAAGAPCPSTRDRSSEAGCSRRGRVLATAISRRRRVPAPHLSAKSMAVYVSCFPSAAEPVQSATSACQCR